jgi:hypothetical protein
VRRIAAADRRVGRDAVKLLELRNISSVRRAVCSVLMLVALLPAIRTMADEHHYYGPALSGLATNAVVAAYEASGLDGDMPAPFRLQNYVVTIHTYGDYFEVLFAGNTTAEIHDVLIAGKTSSIARLQRDPVTKTYPVPAGTEGYVLPGVVAGEIIVGYRKALREKYAPLKTGAYATNFEAYAGGLSIGFGKTQEPTVVSVIPAPTPTPGAWRCLSGCATGPRYSITIRDGRVAIKRLVSL